MVRRKTRLASIRAFLAHKTVPVHAGTLWYYFAGITLFLFVIQVLTGTLLLLYYRPSPSEAYESVLFILTGSSSGGSSGRFIVGPPT
jgi:cytochrome b6